MNLINLTKHTVSIFDEYDNEVAAVQPSGNEARIKTDIKKTHEKDGVPFFETAVLGEPYLVNGDGEETSEFPEMVEDTYYIVFGIFRSNFDRPDLYQPGRLIRNEQGQPIGCVGLSR